MGAQCGTARIKNDEHVYYTKAKNERSARSSKSDSLSSKSSFVSKTEEEILEISNARRVDYSYLRAATRNFDKENLLGEGGFGRVYKGWIDEDSLQSRKPGFGMAVAVKVLKPQSFQGHQEWFAEINYLGQLNHPNLVKLIGYCNHERERLLVYEFMAKGSLEHHLFGRSVSGDATTMAWKLLLNVALDAARGLAFLHSDSTNVIYRDFKMANILLDLVSKSDEARAPILDLFVCVCVLASSLSNCNAKLSDFGLARNGPFGDKSHTSTSVMGTIGYVSPEYMSTGHLSHKNDVYSFGVVLLELSFGRRVIDKSVTSTEHNLVNWVLGCLKDNQKHAMIRVLRDKFGVDEFTSRLMVTKLAVRCVSEKAKNRPDMKEVIKNLETLTIKKNPVVVKENRWNRVTLSANKSKPLTIQKKPGINPRAADKSIASG